MVKHGKDGGTAVAAAGHASTVGGGGKLPIRRGSGGAGRPRASKGAARNSGGHVGADSSHADAAAVLLSMTKSASSGEDGSVSPDESSSVEGSMASGSGSGSGYDSDGKGSGSGSGVSTAASACGSNLGSESGSVYTSDGGPRGLPAVPARASKPASAGAAKGQHPPPPAAATSSKCNNFLPSLYRMCNNFDADHRACITWHEQGASFWISNFERFSKNILPMYYKHNNYASFVRQLNMYGFHRSTEPKGKVAPGVQMVEHFSHEFFQRGHRELLKNIHRKTSKQGGKGIKREGGGAGPGGGGASSADLKELQGQVKAMQASEAELKGQVGQWQPIVRQLVSRYDTLQDAVQNLQHNKSKLEQQVVDRNATIKLLQQQLGNERQQRKAGRSSTCASTCASHQQLFKALEGGITKNDARCGPVVDFLVDSQVDVGKPGPDGTTTLLDIAAKFKRADVATALKSGSAEGAAVAARARASAERRSSGELQPAPAIWLAAREGVVGNASRLLEEGADVHVYSQCDHTPLGVACRQGHLRVVQLLGAFGASTGKEDRVGRTPHQLAQENGHIHVVAWLEYAIGRSALQIAADGRLASAAVWAMRHGRVDPADDHGSLSSIARSKRNYPGALDVCARTARIMRLADGPWTTESHFLYHDKHRECVQTCLLVNQRACSQHAMGGTASTGRQQQLLPLLTPGTWFQVFQFLQRRDWHLP